MNDFDTEMLADLGLSDVDDVSDIEMSDNEVLPPSRPKTVNKLKPSAAAATSAKPPLSARVCVFVCCQTLNWGRHTSNISLDCQVVGSSICLLGIGDLIFGLYNKFPLLAKGKFTSISFSIFVMG